MPIQRLEDFIREQRKTLTCGSEDELERIIDEGEISPAYPAHIRGCALCTKAINELLAEGAGRLESAGRALKALVGQELTVDRFDALKARLSELFE